MKPILSVFLFAAAASSVTFACDNDDKSNSSATGGAGGAAASTSGAAGSSHSPSASGGTTGMNHSGAIGGSWATSSGGAGISGASGLSGAAGAAGNVTGFGGPITLPGPNTKLSDAQVMHVANTLNSGEITEAQQASARAQSTLVRQFADQMILDHTAARQKTEALATAQQVTPAEDAISTALRDQVEQATLRLNNSPDASYDRAYLSEQIAMHEQALKLIDDSLLPSAQSSELDALLTEMRSTVAVHLTQAQAILKTLP